MDETIWNCLVPSPKSNNVFVISRISNAESRQPAEHPACQQRINKAGRSGGETAENRRA